MKSMPAFMQISFKGRINRKRYFWFPLAFAFLIDLPLVLISLFIEWVFKMPPDSLLMSVILFPFNVWGSLLVLSINIRRLHDLNFSGWYILYPLFPFFLSAVFFFVSTDILSSVFVTLFYLVAVISLFYGLYLLFIKGTRGPNKYGEDPWEYSDYGIYLAALSSKESSLSGTISEDHSEK